MDTKNETPETPEQRAERKALWIAKATSHYDTPAIRRQAAKMFEDANPKGKNDLEKLENE